MSNPNCTVTEHPSIGEEFLTVTNPGFIPAVEGYFVTKDNPDYIPAVAGYTETVDNPDYVAPTYTPAHEVWVGPVYTPAVGPKTLEVANPDYVPATPETSEVIHHEAVTVTHWKYTQNGGNGVLWLDYPTHGKIEVDGKTYQGTSHTKEVVVSDAWDETITTPGTPEQGTPTTIIDNPDYVAPAYVPGYSEQVPAVYTHPVGPKVIEVEMPGTGAVGEPSFRVWTEGVPAVGEEALSVENTEYVPGWGEFECEVPVTQTIMPTLTLAQPAQLNAAPVASVAVPVTTPHASMDELAVTGADPLGITAGFGAILLVGAGLTAVAFAKRSRARRA